VLDIKSLELRCALEAMQLAWHAHCSPTKMRVLEFMLISDQINPGKSCLLWTLTKIFYHNKIQEHYLTHQRVTTVSASNARLTFQWGCLRRPKPK
jgi:hypothetical protein